jgi:hypothetical protein
MRSAADSTSTSGNRTSSEERNGLRRRRGGILSRVKVSAKAATNALMQQRLKSWQPVMSPKYGSMHSLTRLSFYRWIIIAFGTIGLLFVSIGGVLLGVCSHVFMNSRFLLVQRERR